MNTLVVGSTRSGKSTAEVKKVIAAAEQRDTAIVVIDPHNASLAWSCFVQLVARAMTDRVLFDRLSNLDRVLGWDFL